MDGRALLLFLKYRLIQFNLPLVAVRIALEIKRGKQRANTSYIRYVFASCGDNHGKEYIYEQKAWLRV